MFKPKARPENLISFLLLALVCGVLLATPLWITRFPPITDLPQHVAQVRLFCEALTQPESPYRINWLTPYSLPYPLIGLSWILFGPANAGRVALIFIGLLTSSLLFLLAFKRKRPAEAAILACLFFFSHILYWGFYQFLLGWPLFLIWILFLAKKRGSLLLTAMTSFIISGLLYFTHILWFLAAASWFGLATIIQKKIKANFKEKISKSIGILPFIALGLIWYPSLAAYGFRSETIWATTPLQRLSFSWLIDASFGGLRGSTETIIFLLVLAWAGLALWQNRRALACGCDITCLYIAAFFFLLALVLPDKQTNTIRFAQRWIPPAFSLFLLGLPPLKLRRSITTLIASLLLASLVFVTSLTWKAFETYELSGLSSCLEKLPSRPRVLGLSFIKESDLVRGRPFIQVFAYSQVVRGGDLNFSFADFGPSLVIFREKRRPSWTPALEWFPELVRKGDFAFFDFVLINGDEKIHQLFGAEDRLAPFTTEGRWRLYKVKR